MGEDLSEIDTTIRKMAVAVYVNGNIFEGSGYKWGLSTFNADPDMRTGAGPPCSMPTIHGTISQEANGHTTE